MNGQSVDSSICSFTILSMFHSLNWIKEHNKGSRDKRDCVPVVAKGLDVPYSSTEHNLPYFAKYLIIAAYFLDTKFQWPLLQNG